MEAVETSTGASHAAPGYGYDPETLVLLGLSRLDGIGFKTLRRIGGREGIRHLIGLKDVPAFDQAIAEAGGRFSLATAGGDWSDLRQNLWRLGMELASALAERRVGIAFEGDPHYPASLNDIASGSRPRWLFYKGDLTLLEQACTTIVGTRDPTPAGEFLARYAVGCAQELGTPVVSGLARGIDRVVHEWCLTVRLPTISVMGTGILSVYPAKHSGLGEEIVKAGGLLITEYLPDQEPSAENFIRRNLLQAAFGRTVIPAEFARKSGTAHTVRFAQDLGRPVYSLSTAGAARAADAGDGDQHFVIPRDHGLFTDALRKAVESGERPGKSEPMQYGFAFGGD